MMRVIVVLLIAAIGLGSAWQLERSRGRVNLQDATIASLQAQAKTTDELLRREREWSSSRETVITALLQVGVDIQVMQDEIRKQDVEQSNVLKELIKNDKVIRDYMQLAVPHDLGVQYERRATTDPTQYGPPSRAVPARTVQPASKGNSKVK